MRKILILLSMIVLMVSFGILSAFAVEAPLSFYDNGGYKYGVALDYTADGAFNDMGGQDGIGDKTQFQALDSNMFIRGTIAFTDVVFPEITRVGFFVEDTKEYVWVDGANIFYADELEKDWWAFVNPASALTWGATCFSIGVNTSIFPEGAHDVTLVAEYEGDAYMIGERTDTYGVGCFVIWINSSGANYGSGSSAPTEPTKPIMYEDIPYHVTIDSEGGIAYFSFTPEENGYYSFFSNSNEDTYGYIYDENMNQLSYDDESGEGNNFKVSYRMTAGTTYILAARYWNASVIGSFEVSVENKEMSEIASGETKTVNVNNPGDVEYFEFTPEEDGYYSFFSNSNEDTYGYIYDENMNQLSYDISYDADYNFKILYRMTAGTTYILAARYWNRSVIGSFEVLVEQLSMSEIASGETTTVNVNNLEDVEYFEFTPEEDGYYSFFSNSNSNETTYGYIYDENMNWLSYNSGYNFKILYRMTAGTTYILAAGYWNDSVIGSFEVSVENKEMSEIASGETTTVNVNNPEDVEYFEFTPEEDGYYSFFSNSNEATYGSIYDENMNLLSYDSGYNFKISYRMTAGTTYILAARYYSNSKIGSFDVRIEKEKCILNLEINTLPYKMDYYDGYVLDVLDYDGLTLKVTWDDGSETIWEWYEYNSYPDYRVGVEHLFITDDTVAEDGIVQISCAGIDIQFQINILENPVSYLEILNSTKLNYIENAGGYKYGEYFKYTTFYPIDVLVKVHYKDGTSKIGSVGEQLDGYYITWDSMQDEDYPWCIGNDNASLVSYLGVSANLPIAVVETPVKSIKIKDDASVRIIENDNGYWNGGEQGYFHYRLNESILSNISVIIEYLDGSTKEAKINDIIRGYRVKYDDDDQYDCHWLTGQDNFATISYLGKETQLRVEIVPNEEYGKKDVDHIEINTKPDRGVYYYGDYNYFYCDSFFGYSDLSFHPSDLTGLTFTVYYKDGTSEFIEYNSDTNCYIDYSENYFLNEKFTVVLNYMGATAEYDVLIKTSDIDFIEVTQLPEITEYKQFYLPDWSGLSFIIHRNGTSELVTIDEANSCYDALDDSLYFEYDGYRGRIICSNSFKLQYLDKETVIEGITYSPTKRITNLEIIGFTFNLKGMEMKVTFSDGTSETINVLEVLNVYDTIEMGYWLACVKTDKGILRLDMNYCVFGTCFDFKEFISGFYEIGAFGKSCKVVEKLDIAMPMLETAEYLDNKVKLEFDSYVDLHAIEKFKILDENGENIPFSTEIVPGEEIEPGSTYSKAFYLVVDDMQQIKSIYVSNMVHISDTFYEKNEIEPQKTICGDLNGDGELNTSDSIYLIKNLLCGDEAYPVFADKDIDGNGVYDLQDAIYLIKHLFNSKAYPIPKKEQL